MCDPPPFFFSIYPFFFSIYINNTTTNNNNHNKTKCSYIQVGSKSRGSDTEVTSKGEEERVGSSNSNDGSVNSSLGTGNSTGNSTGSDANRCKSSPSNSITSFANGLITQMGLNIDVGGMMGVGGEGGEDASNHYEKRDTAYQPQVSSQCSKKRDSIFVFVSAWNMPSRD